MRSFNLGALVKCNHTSSHTLSSEIDRGIYNSRCRQIELNSQIRQFLECRRETGYRHPHLYHCNINRSQKNLEHRRIAESCRKHPCTDLELIEEVDSDSWLLCYSLCMCVKCSECYSLLCICCYAVCYAVCMTSCVEIEVWEEVR